MKETAAFLVMTVIGITAGLWFGTGFSHPYGESDLREACAAHRGVADVETVSWTDNTLDYVAIVVCRDGHVEGVR